MRISKFFMVSLSAIAVILLIGTASADHTAASTNENGVQPSPTTSGQKTTRSDAYILMHSNGWIAAHGYNPQQRPT